MNKTTEKQQLTLYLASPRGFCAGVDRAIKIVEMALEKWGSPVYVRHEIVHNKYVVAELRKKGAIFVDNLADCPDEYPVIFSAHGIAKSVLAEAKGRKMLYVDATCPLVSKVHIEAERLYAQGYQIIMIGHNGHPETIGTMGQLPENAVILIENCGDIEKIIPKNIQKIAYITQTTLSIDDTAEIIKALKARFPAIKEPHKGDICYATTNRQEAVKKIAPIVDAIFIVGAQNSSNSQRLVEVAQKAGCKNAHLINHADDIQWSTLMQQKLCKIGISAGASAPEILVKNVISNFEKKFNIEIELIEIAKENIEFKVPKIFRETA